MANIRSAWGIDIGNRALKAVKLMRVDGRLKVADVDIIEHEQILSSAGDNKESLIQTALANFVQRHQIKKNIVGISVSGQTSFARFIKLPPVEPSKVPEIVKFEAAQQIPFPLDEVEWSYHLFETPDSPDVEVGIFALRKELVNNQIQQFTALDMNVQVVQISPLAVYNGMYYDGRLSDGTTMIIDCGAENTDLIIADGESVWLRTLSIGGNTFTDALTKSFKMDFAKAEELKRNAATSKYQRQIFQSMRPVFADLVSEIQRSIGFYGTAHRDSQIKKIIALGSTFRLPTLQKYLQQNLQLDVERIDGFSGGPPADAKLVATLSENIVSLGTAYGLAVQAMGDSKINSSLLPETIRKAKIWKEKLPWFGLTAACFLVGTAAAYGRWYTERNSFALKGTIYDENKTRIAAATSLDRKFGALGETGTSEKKRMVAINEMRVGAEIWPMLHGDIVSRLPAQPNEDAVKAIARTAREQIVLDQYVAEYLPKIGEALTKSENDFKSYGSSPALVPATGIDAPPAVVDPTTGEPVAAAAAAAPAANGDLPADPRGFLINIRCTTPNEKGVVFVREKFIARLLQLDEYEAYKAGLPYYFARASVVSQMPVKDDPSRITGIPDNPGGLPTVTPPTGVDAGGTPTGAIVDPARPNGGFTGGSRPIVTPTKPAGTDPSVPADPSAAIAIIDPQTGEDMSSDLSFVIKLAVVLDPRSTAKPGKIATPKK